MNAIPTTAMDALFINTFKLRPDELYKERRHRHLKALLPVTTLPLRICQCLVLQFQSAFWDYWREAAFHTSRLLLLKAKRHHLTEFCDVATEG